MRCGINSNWLQQVCHDISVEPSLLPLNGELIMPSSANCIVIMQELTSMQGAGNKVHCLMLGFFIPVIVRPLLFPFFCQHELGKKCENGDRMLIVDGESYLSLHLIEKEATIFYNCLADLLSLKYNTSYHQTLLDALFIVLLIATFCNACHLWEQKVPVSSAFCYLHWAALGGETGFTLKLFVYCCYFIFCVVLLIVMLNIKQYHLVSLVIGR